MSRSITSARRSPFLWSVPRRQENDPLVAAIWIDLDNSPHVPLFAPIIGHFRQKGIDVVLTARDHSQTVGLLDLAGFSGTYAIVGRHYGRGRIDKIRGLI